MADKMTAEQPPALDVKQDDDYRAWYEEAIVASNAAGFAGMSAAQVIEHQDGEIKNLRASVAGLVEALEEIAQSCDSGRHDGLPEDGPALDDVEAWIVANEALAAHRKQQED